MEEKNSHSENQQIDVPFIVHESIIARMERQVKRLWIVLIFALVALLATNLFWIYYESSFETIYYTQDGEGMNNINTGTQGDVNGTDSQNQEAEKQAS